MKKCIKCLRVLEESKFGNSSGANFLRPECRECNNKLSRERRVLKKKYGDPPSNYICPICLRDGEQVKGSGGKGRPPWVRDHNHKTNTFRGWLCHSFNRCIGGLNGGITNLQRAKEYLSPKKWWRFWK